MLVGKGDAGVDEGAGIEVRFRLLGRELEGELGESRGGGVVGEGDVVVLRGRAGDGADDEVANVGEVLDGSSKVSGPGARSSGTL